MRATVLEVVGLLEEHNRLEEEEVYRWPGLLLSAAEREELDAQMRREIENLPPRFT